MIKNDIKVIKEAILGEDFYLPNKQILNTTLKINSNKNLDINSHDNICNYKLECYSNAFNNFEIYFNSIFNTIGSKIDVFNNIKSVSNKKIKVQNDINTSIEKIKDFYLKNSFKEEIFNTHITNENSINFGKVSSLFCNNILNNDELNSYEENNIISEKQQNYFEFFNKELISKENLKKYFLLDLTNIFDEDSDSLNTEDININTYICQNLINATRSLFTLHSGSLKGVPTKEFTNIAKENENLICVSSELDDLKFFNYVNANNLYFDYKSFYNEDYLKYIRESQNSQNYSRLSDTRVNSSGINSDVRSNSFQLDNNYINSQYNSQPLYEFDNQGNENLIEKKLYVTSSTFDIFDNAITKNTKKYLKIHNEFYKQGSKINQDGTVTYDNNNLYAFHKRTLEELMKSFTDIYSLDMNKINSGNNKFLNRWIFIQGKLKGNAAFSSDIDIKQNNIYNSINFDSITNKFLEDERNQSIEAAYQNDISIGINSRRNDYEESADAYVEETTESLLRDQNYLTSDQYDENREDIFYSTLDSKYENIASSTYTASLSFFSYNLNNNQSMIYFRGRPVYEIITPEFNEDYNLENSNQNVYNIFEKDMLASNILKGHNYLSLKTDCIVKKTKINSLKKENIDLDVFKEVCNSISNKKTENRLIAYSGNIERNIVLAKNNNKLFNLLFTKDNDEDNKFYSNFSVTHNEKGDVNFSNYFDLLKNNILPSSDVNTTYQNFNNILKNYYKGNYFKSSSHLLKNIIGDVIKESKNSIEFENYDDISLCQYLYLYYMKMKAVTKSSNENYDIVSKRFIKKAIEKSKQFSGNKDFKEFKFNIDNLDMEDYNLNPKLSIDEMKVKAIDSKENFLKKYFNTSESLKKIKNSVFSSKNLNSMTNNFSLEKSQDITIKVIAQESFNKITENLSYSIFENEENIRYSDILEKLRGEAYDSLIVELFKSFSDSKLELHFNLIKCVLPFKYMFKKCKLNSFNKKAINATKHKLFINPTSPFNYLKNSSNISLINLNKNYEKGKISCDCFVSDRQNKLPNKKISLIDQFDDIFEIDSNKNSIFYSITSKVLDMIKTIDYSFIEKDFKTESDVDNYIDENSFLIDLVTELLEVYGDIYCFYIEKLNQESTLRMLSYSSIENDAVFDKFKKGKEDNYFFDLSYFNSDIKEFNNSIQRSWGTDLLNEDITKRSISEMSRLHLYYEENIDSFISNDKNIIYGNNLKFTKDLEKCLTTLVKSDVCQSITFDFMSQIFNFYLNNTSKINYSKFKESIEIQNSNIDVDKIIMNIFDKKYMNSFYKRKRFLRYYNNLFNDRIKDFQDINNISGLNIFENENQKESRKLNNLKLNSLSKNIINSDLYSHVLSLKEMGTINYDSLIKVKVQIIDHSRLDRIFLPKIFYFSPALYVDNFSKDSRKINLYDITQYDDKRILSLTYEDLEKNTLFRNIIVDKFNLNNMTINNLDNESVYNLIIKDIYDRHIDSNSIENFIEAFYNIKLDEKQISNKISIKTYDFIVEKIDKNTFFDIFSTNKDRFIEKCFHYVEDENSYFIKSKEDKYDKVTNFIMYLNNIMSTENDEMILNDINSYDNLSFNISTNDFMFILNNKDKTLENLDNNTHLLTRQEINNIDLVKYYFEDIDIDSIIQYGVYRFGDIDNIDNFSVSISSEVI